MSVADHEASLTIVDDPQKLNLARLPATPWEPRLCEVMSDRSMAAFEEALMPVLLADLRRRSPAHREHTV